MAGRSQWWCPRRTKPCSISFRLLISLTTFGLIAGTTLVLSQFYEHQLRGTLVEEAETRLLLDARNVAALGAGALLSEYPELTLMPLVRDIHVSRAELSEMIIVDRNGLIQGAFDPRSILKPYQPVAGLRTLRNRSFLIAGETLAANDRVILATTPILHHSEGEVGKVIVSLEKHRIEEMIRAKRADLVKVVSLLLSLVLAVSLGVMRVVSRPLVDLQRGLRRIGRGDLGRPVVVRGISELRSLGETLNEMTAQLQHSRSLAEAREAEVIATQREVIMTIGDVVESRSHETANHTRRVGAMSRELALLAGMPEELAEQLRMAAPMHDVGKIGIPDRILNKPGRLSDEEYETMKTHADIGHSILVGSERPILKAAAIIAHQHHENWDGSGYPQGLQGEEIHRYGRIVALVDVFDALNSDRVYRPAMPLEMTLRVIRDGRDTRFDPHLVDLFLDNLDSFLAISERLSDSKSLAVATVVAVAEEIVDAAIEEPVLV